MNMAIIGSNGRMGRLLSKIFAEKYTIYGIDKNTEIKSLKDLHNIDIVLDFSSPTAIDELRYALQKKIFTLSGTTGYKKEQIEELYKLGNGMFYWSCNYAKGINYFVKLIEIIVDEYEIIGLVELHNDKKKDAPSGTALMLKERFGFSDDKIQSVRLRNANATHAIMLASENERITIIHEVLDKNAFVDGILERIEEKIDDKKAI